MNGTQFETGAADREQRFEDAISNTAPGTPLRMALDMILAGHLGALVCVGDTENVLAAGDDGFKLDVSFTANRLFELCKMDGAVVVDRDLTKILRANYHLNPDPSLPTSETGTRHRTAALHEPAHQGDGHLRLLRAARSSTSTLTARASRSRA